MKWNIIRSKPKKEQVLASAAMDLGFETYIPWIKSTIIRKEKILTVRKPLISGYVFIKEADNKQTEKLHYLPGSAGMLFFDNKPAKIEQSDIERMQHIITEGYDLTVVQTFSTGDKVRILSGVLAGNEGYIGSRTNNQDLYIESGIANIWFRIKNGSAKIQLIASS
ncbi:MAG: transcription termination/antitermination NusG family protein [Bacteroidales bacterium]|nr:transcription termination/antitermination NusG family protein [Bacteroidales bacterium]